MTESPSGAGKSVSRGEPQPNRTTGVDSRDAFLLDILSRSADFVCLVDADTRLDWVSPGWSAHLGWSEDALLSRPFAEFLHPADAGKTVRALKTSLDGEDVKGLENRCRTADGRWINVEWTAAGRRDGEEVVFAIGRDVTEQRRRQQLLEERARLMVMTENLGDIGHWWVDLRTSTSRFTRVVFEIYGLDPAGPAPSIDEGLQWYHPDDRDRVRSRVEYLIETGEPYELAARIVRRDGSIRHVVAAGTADFEDGVATGIFGIIRDVTAERELEKRVRHAERMASLGTISAGVAHEINNPLTWVRGNLELLLGHLEDLADEADVVDRGELVEAARSALKGSARIRQIVQGLSAFSRDEPRLEAVQIADVVDAALAMGENEITHRARLEIDVEPNLVVLGNETQLVEVLINLLVNAAQSIDQRSGVEGRVQLEARQTNPEHVTIRVLDNGVGIPEGLQSHVWDPFFTTKPVGLGTGLGLPIVHGLVTSHGGSIDLESREGHGTTITLSLVASSRDGEEVAPRAPGPASVESALHGPSTVLLVDDEPSVLKLLERCVGSHMKVITAGGGREAIEALKTEPEIELVCCDIMMPEVSGVEVFHWIEQNRADLLPNVLMITGGVFTDAARRFIAESQPELLNKPFSVRDVRDRLSRLLQPDGPHEA